LILYAGVLQVIMSITKILSVIGKNLKNYTDPKY